MKPRQSRRIPADTVPVAGFADDIALLSDLMELLRWLEDSAESVGLYMNAKNTSCCIQPGPLGLPIPDFVYLGAWVDSSVRDIKIRRAKAWSACHKMKTVWNSTMSKAMEVRLFIAT